MAEVGGRRRLFPAEMSQLGLIPHDGIWEAGQLRMSSAQDASQTLVLATCDPAAALLATQMAHTSSFRLLVLQRCTRAALELLSKGLIHVAGLHVGHASDPAGNVQLVREVAGRGYRLLHAARWQEGVAFRPQLQLSSLRAVARARIRWVGREAGSAARAWLDDLLTTRALPRRIARDHRGVADAVRCGWADAGVCHRLVSEDAGLSFLSFPQETYDLCYPVALAGDPRLRMLVTIVQSSDYRRQLAELPGFAVTDTGQFHEID
jgi:molybdate-binding protein